jgi:quercetin dioxygenase-like cupin family protein
MKFTTSIIPIVTGSFVLAALLVFACTETSQLDSEALTTEISELSADKNHALPPVTGDPAFIWSIDDPDIQWGPCPEFFPDGCELAILQGDPAENNADALLKLPANSTADHHWHTSRERMILLAGEMEVDYDGQDPVTLEQGNYAYGPAGLAHVAHCKSDEDCYLYIAFEDPVDAIATADQDAPGSDEEAYVMNVPDVEFGGCPDFFPEGCGLTILQGDPAQDNADALLRLTPGSTVPMHWHTSAERMILLSGEFRVNFQGQAPVVIGEFDYAYGPAKLPHDARCMEQEDDCLLFIAFEEPVDAVDVRGGNLPHRR